MLFLGDSMAKEKEVPTEVTTKSEMVFDSDIENIYTNYTQFFMSEDDIVMHHGFKSNYPDKQQVVITHRVIMGHHHAKQVLKSLTKIIEYFEEKKTKKENV